MVGKKRTLRRGGDAADDGSAVSSWTACCRTRRGLVSDPLDCIEQPMVAEVPTQPIDGLVPAKGWHAC